MKNKRLNFFRSLTLMLFLLLGLSACKDECLKNAACEYGSCIDGTCECDDGFEGENCDVEMGAKLLGNYAVSYTCLNIHGVSVAITPGTFDITDVNRETVTVLIENLFGPNLGFLALKMTSPSEFDIETQILDNWVIQGNGALTLPVVPNAREITLTVFLEDLSSSFNTCELVLTEMP